MQGERRTSPTSVPGPVEPGVDLVDAGGGGRAAPRRRFAGGAFLLRRSQSAPGRGLDGFGLTGGFDLEAVKPAFQRQLPREGLPLVGLGAQSMHVEPVLIDLIAMGIDGGLTRTQGPVLGRSVAAGGGQKDGGGENGGGSHANKMGPMRSEAKRGRQPGLERVQTRVRLTAESSSSRVVGTAYSASRSNPAFGK